MSMPRAKASGLVSSDPIAAGVFGMRSHTKGWFSYEVTVAISL